jgi:hypothetical protein
MEPDALMQQASRYFTGMTDVILAQGGTVDKFIGDAVMAFWNAPHPRADHCERACRAALLAKTANEGSILSSRHLGPCVCIAAPDDLGCSGSRMTPPIRPYSCAAARSRMRHLSLP